MDQYLLELQGPSGKLCEEKLNQLLTENKISWSFNLRRAT